MNLNALRSRPPNGWTEQKIAALEAILEVSWVIKDLNQIIQSTGTTDAAILALRDDLIAHAKNNILPLLKA